MPRPPVDLHAQLREIVTHVEALPAEAQTPLGHFTRTSSDVWNLYLYLERNLPQPHLSPAAIRKHMGRLHGMIVVNLIQTFERYLKEAAAISVDSLARHVLDDRFNAFKIQGSSLAAHFGTDTLGGSLCEGLTWLDSEEINDRFRRLLAPPFETGTFLLFPKQPAAERQIYDSLSLVWQLRHTIVHNVGVLTQSDALKLRLLVKSSVASRQVIVPTRKDLRYLKRFLDESAHRANERIGKRLAELLTDLHAADPTLFTPRQTADRLTRLFGLPLTVAGATGTPPP
jgi:hypothetical protein